MPEQSFHETGLCDGIKIDRRAEILVELQQALVRQSRHQRLMRAGKSLAVVFAGCGILAWYLFTSAKTPAPVNGIAKTEIPVETSSEPDPGISSYSGIIVHTNPDLLKTVLVTNSNMASKSVVETVSDDELAALIAASSAPFIVARIDNQLVAVPVREKSRPRSN